MGCAVGAMTYEISVIWAQRPASVLILDRLVAQEVNVKENVCSPTHDGTGQKYGPGPLKKEVWGWKK